MASTPEPITAEPPPRPAGAALGLALTDVVFLHWACEPDLVGPLLPPGTRADGFDGAAYIGIVVFRMHSFGSFLELNVRTYSVDERGRRAVVFLTMEADRLPWVLASRTAALPYKWSLMSQDRAGDLIGYRSERRWPAPRGLGARIRIRVGQPVDGTPLDHFLTARWWMHQRVPGATLTARLWHERWPLHAAQLLDLDEDLVASTGLPTPAGPPTSVLYSPGVRGRLGLPTPAWRSCRSGRAPFVRAPTGARSSNSTTSSWPSPRPRWWRCAERDFLKRARAAPGSPRAGRAR